MTIIHEKNLMKNRRIEKKNDKKRKNDSNRKIEKKNDRKRKNELEGCNSS